MNSDCTLSWKGPNLRHKNKFWEMQWLSCTPMPKWSSRYSLTLPLWKELVFQTFRWVTVFSLVRYFWTDLMSQQILWSVCFLFKFNSLHLQGKYFSDLIFTHHLSNAFVNKALNLCLKYPKEHSRESIVYLKAPF